MTLYAEIAINAAVPNALSYIVPDWLENDIRVGHLVNVGVRTSRQPGIVMRLTDSCPVPQPKTIAGLLDPKPVLSAVAVDLAWRLSEEYLAPIGLCAWLWLPPNLLQHVDYEVNLLDKRYAPENGVESEVFALLGRRGTLRFSQISAVMYRDKWRDAVENMANQGVVETNMVLVPPQPKTPRIQTAKAAFHPSNLADALSEIPVKLKRAETLAHILRVLAREDDAVDVSWIYAQTGAKVADLQKLDSLDLVYLGEKKTWRDALMERDYVPAKPPPLTNEQVRAWAHIEQAAAKGAYAGFLLHGVTGSGKTEVYLRAIEQVLKQGRQAIYLVPEIALTAQTIRRVQARFPGRAAVIHSRIADAERYRIWQRVRAGEVEIIVGPRSALFMPLPDVGLVVVDEEHDGSYRSMGAPVYDARRLAEWWMRANDGLLILGSATPDLETLLRSQTRELMLLELPHRVIQNRQRVETQAARNRIVPRGGDVYADAVSRGLPPVTLVDMREELKLGNATIFSRALADALQETLANGEQALLYLNRRGTSTYVFCRDCGYAMRCPNCNTPLIYHEHDYQLRCHLCGHTTPNPDRCPQCQSDRIRYFGAGTQHVEAEVAKRFPSARIIRWDSDVISNPEVHDALLTRFLDHQADIIVGTMMVTKGLDLPLVTLVGVVSADVALNMPDFHNAERGFQLITQAIGRAGRGLKPGRAVVQSHTPEHYAVAHAVRHDYAGFAREELEYRQKLGYPPFRRMARVVFRHANAARARDLAEQAARALNARIADSALSGTDLIGPAPCFFQRIANEYRWQVIVRAPDPRVLLRDVAAAKGWLVEMDPDEVL